MKTTAIATAVASVASGYTTNAVIDMLIARAKSSAPSTRFTQEVDCSFLKDVRVNVYPGQRHHGKLASRKAFLEGQLWGDQLTFTAVYVKKEGKVWIIDGNNRIERLVRGHGTTMPAGNSALLVTHIVDTMEKSDQLYDMFNSMAAAKNSGDAFDSGLRQTNMLELITSHLINKGGRATGAQLAYGKKGSRYTKAATVALIDGIHALDRKRLYRHGEVAGQIGAYIAVAHHTLDTDWLADLADSFIRACNERAFDPKVPTERDLVIHRFRRYVVTHITGGTGGKVNQAVFEVALKAFIEYVMASSRQVSMSEVAVIMTTDSTMQGISLAAFIDAIAALKVLKGL